MSAACPARPLPPRRRGPRRASTGIAAPPGSGRRSCLPLRPRCARAERTDRSGLAHAIHDARGFVEEGGQRVRNGFWQEAHGADVPGRLRESTAPCYLVFGTKDEYISTENREALIDAASPADRVDVFEGYPHSAWTAEQADDVIGRSTGFLADLLPS